MYSLFYHKFSKTRKDQEYGFLIYIYQKDHALACPERQDMLATHSIIIIVASAFYLSSKWEIMGLGSSGKSFRYSAEWRSGSWSPNSACHKIRKYTVGLTSTLKGKVKRYFQPPVFSPFKLTKATDQRVNRRIIRLFLFEKNDYTGYQILMR